MSIILATVFLFSIIPSGLFSVTASAETITYTDGYYTYTVQNDEVEIIKVDTSISGKIEVPSVLGNYSVTSIGDYAFEFCVDITEITIPETVVSIGIWAFKDCNKLENIIMHDNLKILGANAFSGTAWFKNQLDGLIYVGKIAYKYKGNCPDNINIQDGTISISGAAFHNVTGLKNITIPDSVISIGGSAFNGCTSLKSIIIPDSVIDLGSTAFYNCVSLETVKIGNKVGCIGNNTFLKCSSLKSINIPNSVTQIGDGAFNECSALTSVKIGDGVENIGVRAFNYCSDITDISIGKKVKTIGYQAFCRCSSITNINIPASVIGIDYEAFSECTGLKAVHITDIAAWCNISFAGLNSNPLYYAEKLYLNGSEVYALNIPDKVTTIKQVAFYNCKSIRNVYIPDSVTSIGASAFAFCTSLEEVHITDMAAWCGISFTGYFSNPLYCAGNLYINDHLVDRELIIPSGVTQIADYAFYEYSNITSVILPQSISFIGDSSFAYCRNIKDVWYVGTQYDRMEISISNSNSYLIDATWHYKTCQENHVYSGSCDTLCNNCEWERETTIDHSFYDTCDIDCNICGHVRTITHNYEWAIDKSANCGESGLKHEECIICHLKRNENTIINATGNHNFSDDYDETCNVCNQEFNYIVFDVNIGTGAFETIRKLPDETISLPKAVPSRSGYNFAGWSSAPNGEVEYLSGNNYSANKSVTLYAQWNLHCEKCIGKGYEFPACSKCKGEGEVDHYIMGGCNYCNGVGGMCSRCGYPQKFTLDFGPCSNCGYNKGVFCSYCGGSGNEKTRVECDNCEGRGSTSAITCRNCSGSGECVRASVPAPSTPILVTKTSTSFVLQPIENGEYSIDGVNWQLSPIFENLEIDKTYTIYQRYAKTDTTLRSETSEALTITLVSYVVGDIDGVKGVTDADAEYMLMFTFFPDDYPVNQTCDFNGDGFVNDADAEHLLMYTFFPEDYPLH